MRWEYVASHSLEQDWSETACQTERMRAGMLDRCILSQKKNYPWGVAWGNSPQHRAGASCKARQVEIWIMICLATCTGDWVIQFRFRLYTQNGYSTAHFPSWTWHNKFSVKLRVELVWYGPLAFCDYSMISTNTEHSTYPSMPFKMPWTLNAVLTYIVLLIELPCFLPIGQEPNRGKTD